jgi:glycosyltransferase involved in cell wall biosynthesis
VIAATEHNTYMNKSRRAIWADRMLARATTQMLAVSGAVRSFASRQASLSQDRYLVVPNGVPVKEIQLLTPAQKERKRAEIGLPLEKPVAISVGRLTEQKGIQHLLRAAKIHLREFPDTVFLVVGDGPLRTDLHALAASLELLPSLRFLGARDDVWELLQVSDLLVMPSLWEGLPVAMIEAAACGIPVVASRVGGVEEVVEDGVSGLLVPPGDDAALASSIAYMLSVPERRLQMGGEARRRVEERFSVDRVGKAIADLYCHLWGRTQTASRKRSD